jgi:hypothetical protein
MPKKCAGVTATNRTAASLIQGPLIDCIARVLNIQLAGGGERLAGAAVTGGKDAIEHVHATGDGFDQVFGRAHAHEISRPTARHARRDLFDNFKHHGLFFPHAETAYGIAVKADLDRSFQAFAPQVEV